LLQQICCDAWLLSIRNRSGELNWFFSPVRTPELTALAWGAIFPALVGA
jgi:hypothetical protein